MKNTWKRILGGLLATIMVLTAGGLALATEGNAPLHKLRVLAPENGNQYIKFTERDQYPFWTEFTSILAQRGLELEFEIIPNDQFQVVSQTRMASGVDLPDMINLSYLDQVTALNLAKQGTLVPIGDILEYSDGTAKDFLNGPANFSRKLNTMEDGNSYWISSVLITTWGDTVCQSPVVPCIRKDWLDALGMSVPTTTGEFLETLVAFQENDMNGNNMADEVAVFPPNFIGNPVAAWFGVGTDLVSVRLDVNEIVCPWYQEAEMKEFILYMRSLIEAGVYDIALVEQDELQTQLNVENKISCIVTYGTGMYLEPMVNVGSAPPAEYQPFGPIQAIDGVNAYATGDPAMFSYSRYGFTKDLTDLEGAAKLIDFLSSEEYYLLSEWGLEGVTYEFVDGVPQFLEGIGQPYWQEMAENRVTNGFYLYGIRILPRVYPGQNLQITESKAAPYKLAYMEEFNKYPYKALTSGDENSFMALPTDEELELKADIYTDLKTYSDETFVQLLMGDLSLDDWDDLIAEFKNLGLDDFIKMQTDRFNRYLAS